jgi:hypothetical protein
VYPSAFGAEGEHTRWVERGWGVNILEDAKHCSVLYICKYFVEIVLYSTYMGLRKDWSSAFEQRNCLSNYCLRKALFVNFDDFVIFQFVLLYSSMLLIYLGAHL